MVIWLGRKPCSYISIMQSGGEEKGNFRARRAQFENLYREMNLHNMNAVLTAS